MIKSALAVLLVFPLSAASQAYYGYQNSNGTGQQPNYSYEAGATLTCASGFTSSQSHPAGCYLTSPTVLLSVGKSVIAPQAGVGTLYCQGITFLSCTLVVSNPNSHPPTQPPPPPPPDPTAGGYYRSLGGVDHSAHCNPKGLAFSVPTPLLVNTQITLNVSLNNLGGGFCSTSSGMSVDWGDGSPVQAFPTVHPLEEDPCAPTTASRLAPPPISAIS